MMIKKYQIDVNSADIVRTIFERYAKGDTTVSIIDYLNTQGAKTSKGLPFNKNSLRTLLKNKKYIGYYTYKDTETINGVPRIINDNLFNEVQVKLERNKKARSSSKAKEEYILTTKVFCGQCKEMMRGYGGTSRSGKLHLYYACNGKIRKKCDKKAVPKDYLENIIISKCKEQLTDTNINLISREVVSYYKNQLENNTLKRLNQLLKENERKNKNLMSALLETDNEMIRRALYEQMPILEGERKIIEKEIATENIMNIPISESSIKFFLKSLKKGNETDVKYRKMLVNVLVNSIYIYDDSSGNGKYKITIILNTSTTPIDVTSAVITDIERDNSSFECSFNSENKPPFNRH